MSSRCCTLSTSTWQFKKSASTVKAYISTWAFHAQPPTIWLHTDIYTFAPTHARTHTHTHTVIGTNAHTHTNTCMTTPHTQHIHTTQHTHTPPPTHTHTHTHTLPTPPPPPPRSPVSPMLCSLVLLHFLSQFCSEKALRRASQADEKSGAAVQLIVFIVLFCFRFGLAWKFALN